MQFKFKKLLYPLLLLVLIVTISLIIYYLLNNKHDDIENFRRGRGRRRKRQQPLLQQPIGARPVPGRIPSLSVAAKREAWLQSRKLSATKIAADTANRSQVARQKWSDPAFLAKKRAEAEAKREAAYASRGAPGASRDWREVQARMDVSRRIWQDTTELEDIAAKRRRKERGNSKETLRDVTERRQRERQEKELQEAKDREQLEKIKEARDREPTYNLGDYINYPPTSRSFEGAHETLKCPKNQYRWFYIQYPDGEGVGKRKIWNYKCSPCPKGQISPYNTRTNSDSPKRTGTGCVKGPCRANYYRKGNKCMACPAHLDSPAGSVGENSCVCRANFFREGDICEACPPHYTSPAGSVGHTSCRAVICPMTKYRVGRSCKSCPGFDTSRRGSIGVNQCQRAQCDANYYDNGKDCIKCPAGTGSRIGSVGAHFCRPVRPKRR